MASLWEYDTSVLRPDRDVVGYDVEAADGSIGKIDEASYDAAASYLVVDTGFWIFGKKRLIPAGVIRRVDDEDRTVYVAMTKDQIKSAPDFEARDPMTATATTRTTDRSSDDRAEGGLPMTSAHPRPSAPPARASEPGYRSQPTSSSPVGAHTATPKETLPGGLLQRYRAGATVTALAREFGVSFDWVAQRIIAAGARRDELPQRRARRRPAELDSDEWLGAQLAGGAGVGDLSRRLHVTPSTVRNALRHYATRAHRPRRRSCGQIVENPTHSSASRPQPAGSSGRPSRWNGRGDYRLQRSAKCTARDSRSPRSPTGSTLTSISWRTSSPPTSPSTCMTPWWTVIRLGRPAPQDNAGLRCFGEHKTLLQTSVVDGGLVLTASGPAN